MKRTKIICTIGPATESAAKIKALAKAGMNCVRLNFSHGTHEHHRLLIKNVRAASKKLKVPLAIIQDLQGPRLRLGKLPSDGIAIKRGEIIAFVFENEKPLNVPAGAIVLPTQEPLGKFMKKGEIILIKDGLVRLRATLVKGSMVVAKVEQGDVLTSNRGLNLPESNLPDAVLTKKDREDLKFGLAQGVDWIALSFARGARDIKRLRQLLPPFAKASGGKPATGGYIPKIIAKIERQEAVENFDEILEAADAIMIARGDLGIELPAEQIPLLQKQFITKCLAAAKPVIVATQLLESMTVNTRPTRAEVSDVANAVIDHADCLMLSGETSTGKFPVETCRMMNQIIEETEASPYDDLGERPTRQAGVAKIIARTAEEVVDADHIRAIVVMSSSGRSAQLVSSERPEVPIVALTQNEMARRQLSLVWGVSPFLMRRFGNVDDLIKASVKLVRKELKVRPGEKILIASGHPTGPHGSLNLLKIHTV